ncbi:cellobiose transport system substrate-binding protein [Microlunatus sagamiharensis]|uniref:Cellobiose transport system substrate-binding protein n=1 Tax=Microlunatus sagamiharensis TaxID=546874 RepID=A0A1H2NEA7_9ACTN|nr:extracellular solute-binding protein [Microlunatus sagamiharensis]SDV03807.1 cellobiose transport system substrate-binding protein [Microlunatus sagamiharensis]
MSMRTRHHRLAALAAGVTTLALALTGCGGSGTEAGGGSGSAASGEKVELTVTTFGTMGFDKLYAQYEATHPDVTIKPTNIDTGDNALVDWKTKQAAGSGLPDVQAVEEGWLGQVMKVSSSFTDLREQGADAIKDRWVPWKLAQGTDPEGRVIGYGTDIGPEGLCYNRSLFKAAGLPSDREDVAELFGGDQASWANFFEVGKQYHDKTGKAFYDQSGFVWNAMVNQQPVGYYTADDKLNIDGNAALRGLWDQLGTAASQGLSANQTQWDWGKGKAFTDGSFATFVCPGWMLGVVKGQVTSGGGDAKTGWDFADVFPGGAANWGGSFLTVPKTSKHPAEAAALADWLTQPAQQAAAFQAAGTFPSGVQAQTDPGVTGTNELSTFFNDAPVGTILGKRAQGVTAQHKGPQDSVIQSQVFGPAVKEIDKGVPAGQAWDNAIKTLGQVVES